MPNAELQRSNISSLRDLVEKGIISPEIARLIGATADFGVSFESTQLPGLSEIVKAHIIRVDDLSRQHAEQRGGLVYYHAGEVDPITLEAFSACFWESREAAARALHGPSIHSCEAVPLAKSGLVYARYAIKFHGIKPDERLGFIAEPYEEISGHSFVPTIGQEG